MVPSITAVDLFCGAGGTSTGIVQACEDLGIKLNLTAINHWPTAINTHKLNHPDARHLCETLDALDPRKVITSRLNVLVASPECTHHSVARGGKPVNDQSRASAWHIVRWAETLQPDNILIENVKEFETWAPLGSDGRPLKSKKGEIFKAFIAAIRSLGYTVDWRVLNAANYGDATTRKRLFIQARRGRRKIAWPEPTHSPNGVRDLFSEKSQWRAAKDIIDWNLKGQSIFKRKRKLAPSTIRRIEAGLRKFGGTAAEPFIVILRNHSDAKSVNDPLPTITAGGEHFGLCEPFLIGAGGPQGSAKPKSINEPLNTVLTENHISLIEPFLVAVNHSGSDESRCHPVDKPMPVVTCKNGYGVVEPVLEKDNVPESFVLHLNRNNDQPVAVSQPMQTITATSSDFGLVQPFLIKYYGNGGAVSIDEPLDTITTKDRFGLVEIDGEKYYLDIRFRMLQPHELARAMGFGDDYQFTGNRAAVVKQIGNAVPVCLATALLKELLLTDTAIMAKAA